MEPAPAMVLLSGLPGSGKTTFARALLGRLAAVHIESDAVRRQLFPQPAYVPREHARVFRTMEDRAAAALAKDLHVIVDATNLVDAERRRFLRAAAGACATLVSVRLTAPEAIVRERLSAPRDGWSQADVRVYELMRDRPRPFRGASIVVDSRFAFGPAVDLVLTLIHDQER